MTILNKKLSVGEFDSEADAKNAFFDYKKAYIDDLAEKCKGKIPDYAYEAMKRWKVKEQDIEWFQLYLSWIICKIEAYTI